MRYLIFSIIVFSVTFCSSYTVADYTVEQWNERIENDPNNPVLYMYRGGAKGKLGDYLGGIEDYDKAIELKPNPYYYFSRGKLKKALGNYDGAIQDYNKALEFVPDDASIYAERGLTKIDDGQKESGCEDLSKAVELEKKVTVPNEKYNIEFKKHCK